MIVFYMSPFGMDYIKTSANGAYDAGVCIIKYIIECVCVYGQLSPPEADKRTP